VVDCSQVVAALFVAVLEYSDCPQVAEALFDSLAAFPAELLVVPMNLMPMLPSPPQRFSMTLARQSVPIVCSYN
jgi:hypothetical protein